MDMNQLGPDAAGVPGIVRADEMPQVAPVVDDAPIGDVIEQPDGSAIVMAEKEEEQTASDFSDNLADGFLKESYLTKLGTDICDAVESDKKVREERDKQYAEGIKRTGLGNDSPGGADFTGASRAVHPMLAKGCVDFSSRAIKELFPAQGPCRTQIVGESTDSKVDKAERKKQFMNWQMTTQVPENRPEYERLLSQLPLGGSQYKRWWWDAAMERPRTETVYVDDVFLPYNQADFYSSYRVTHRQYVNEDEYNRRVESGLYRDLKLSPPPSGLEDKSKARTASDKVEGSEEDTAAYGEEGLREIYQVYADLEVDGDNKAKRMAPYILHIDVWSHRVLGVYRNWKEDDERFAKKHWMVEFTFIPWRGAYGVGLFHLIGSLAVSATGAVRAILDAAHIQNFPGGLKLKAGRNSGQSIQVNATELAEIQAPPNVDDIRKLVMPFPFNGPSAVLFQLLEWLTQQAESVVTTASERIADGGGANMPVGTAMALIEHDSVNFSSIHARLHNSMKQEMAILHRLNAENLSDEEVVEDLGELVVSNQDFQGPVDIIPVSDPNIFSEAQRYAQLQAVLQLKADPQFAPFFKADRLLQRALKLLQIPAPDDVANLPKDPTKLGPLEENYAVACAEPKPLKVYEDQDDILHLETHSHFMVSPIYGASPLIGPQALPALLQHCKEHLLALYRKHTQGASDAMMLAAKMQNMPITEEQAEGRGAAFADKALAEALGPMVMPALKQAQKLAQGMAPKPPASPDAMLMASTQEKIAQMKDAGDTQRRTLELQYDEKRDAAEQAQNQGATQITAQLEAFQTQTQNNIAEMTAQLQVFRDQQNNQNKIALAELQGQQAAQLEALKAMLATLPAVPDFTGQLEAMGQQNEQVSADLTTRIEALSQQHEKDKATIAELLTALSQNVQALSVKKPRQPKGATNGEASDQ